MIFSFQVSSGKQRIQHVLKEEDSTCFEGRRFNMQVYFVRYIAKMSRPGGGVETF
jgi:hypothetical protein